MLRFTTIISAAAIVISASVLADDQIYPDASDYSDIYDSETYDWSGFYAGISGGYGLGQALVNGGTGKTLGLRGGIIGAQAGYAAMYKNYVFGIEANISASSISGKEPCANPTFTCIGELRAMAGIEALAGVSVDRFLIYGKLGAAYGYARADTDPTYPGYEFGSLGYSVGGGVEYGLTENVSARLEYSYLAFHQTTAPAGTTNSTADTYDPSIHLLKAGLNYRF